MPAATVVMRIRRFNPELDTEPRWQTFRVAAQPEDTVLDVLHSIKWHADASLTFRRSSATGACGSDAMRIDGVNRLASTTRVDELAAEITVEPIKGLAVIRDLVVDMAAFYDAYRAVRPILRPCGDAGNQEMLQSPEQRDRYAASASCNLCAACTTACPVFWTDGSFFGPAAIVAAHRFVFDSRDTAGAQRLEILNDRDGVWRCRTTFNCTDACPRGIEVTRAIQQVKRAQIFRRI